MRIRVHHRTSYRYDQPISYAIQSLRMTPREHTGQRVIEWRLTGEDGETLPSIEDGFANIVSTHTVNRMHQSAEVVVSGVVETSDTQGVVRNAPEPLPLAYYLRTTPLTQAGPAIHDLSRTVLDCSLDTTHRLLDRIRAEVAYEVGTTEVFTPAEEALTKGRGVCQDHAHVMIAAARQAGIPARYISGYLWTGSDEEFEASHAWAELYVPDLGWVGFDPANGICPTESYIRVAIGLDYWTAAPVRGIRHGLAEEKLDVSVRLMDEGAATQ